MTQEKLEFDNVTFKINHEGDLEIIVEHDGFWHDAHAFIKPEEIAKLRDFLILVIPHGR